jgi:beta-lactamase regulating signal transducer with metallopeptidase domain
VLPSVETSKQVESITQIRIQRPGGNAVMLLRIIWTAVASTFLLQMLWSHLQLRRIRRNALPWTMADMPPYVDVLLHSGIAAPLTLGFLRPAILLPMQAPEWAQAEIRRAVVHELEHIHRGDWPIQLIARFACSLYWFLPLSWIAWRRLCLEAERSCDDAVLQESDSLNMRISWSSLHGAFRMARRRLWRWRDEAICPRAYAQFSMVPRDADASVGWQHLLQLASR